MALACAGAWLKIEGQHLDPDALKEDHVLQVIVHHEPRSLKVPVNLLQVFLVSGSGFCFPALTATCLTRLPARRSAGSVPGIWDLQCQGPALLPVHVTQDHGGLFGAAGGDVKSRARCSSSFRHAERQSSSRANRSG